MTRDLPAAVTQDDGQAKALTDAIAALMRQFKLEPGLLAGSAYGDLHANDVGLLSVLGEAGDWTVRGLAQALSAPDSTISSALDRLESRDLVARRRRTSDRRVMRVELTAEGLDLMLRLRAAQLNNSRNMLARLSPQDRADLIRLVSAVSQGKS
ncbi:winged helix-turn-helix transcriptional regulator [Phenylobacterium sp. 20VBR1]|uniref:Winged helix-turn-helix transcriptional regulator n=1 Tax=Phenylobacterium glaciei TaxID=2803784 RepID=A0A941CZX1_9CAUL|nr:MarR family winged helix-turn-helix transcriptional regulator [Phenylobacterium glaciei]MBR7618251.1 winged helix-turn-helix transcriptional regulator [Phenylobacterium glaciei]